MKNYSNNIKTWVSYPRNHMALTIPYNNPFTKTPDKTLSYYGTIRTSITSRSIPIPLIDIITRSIIRSIQYVKIDLDVIDVLRRRNGE